MKVQQAAAIDKAPSVDTAWMELPCAVLLADADGGLIAANNDAQTLLHCGPDPTGTVDALLARSGVEGKLPHPRSDRVDVQLKLVDGRTLNARAKRLSSGGMVVTLADISSYTRDMEAAQRDALTGLASRSTLQAYLTEMLIRGQEFVVFFIDLDRFKAINDTLGHAVGDVLLRKVAERICSTTSDGFVARLGGDEFVLVEVGKSPEEAQTCAARLVDLVGRTYVIDGHMANVGCSVGIALAPADASDVTTIMKNADLALYRSKAEGRGRFRFFEPSMDARMQRRRSLELGLRKALALKEFDLAYQPQVQLDSGEVCGFEALLRWHTVDGPVSPAEFIPVAEETGLIVSIGEWVLRTACAEAASWSRPVSVAVNVSAQQFAGGKLIDTVTSALAHSTLPAQRLDLEITEGVLLEDTETVLQTLHSLKALGVRVSMDDFGTGYSSLSYLQKFPFDKIKIDQSFVRGLKDNPECGAIVRAVARLGASLGIKTTAEGVETEAELRAIEAEGCIEVQGFLTGRPVGAKAAAAMLMSSKLKEGSNGRSL